MIYSHGKINKEAFKLQSIGFPLAVFHTFATPASQWRKILVNNIEQDLEHMRES